MVTVSTPQSGWSIVCCVTSLNIIAFLSNLNSKANFQTEPKTVQLVFRMGKISRQLTA
jgi:hypothetical protein